MFPCPDSPSHYELAHTPGSQESIRPRGSPEKWESTSLRDSASEPYKGLDDRWGNLDRYTLGSETNSEYSARNFSEELSQDTLERSAEARSTPEAPSSGMGSDQGTERQMAPCVARQVAGVWATGPGVLFGVNRRPGLTSSLSRERVFAGSMPCLVRVSWGLVWWPPPPRARQERV